MSRWARLEANATFAGGVLERWHHARVGAIGAGNVGSRFAREAVRSGATVWVCDPEDGETANLGTQAVRRGQAKALAVSEACNGIRAGSATATVADVRHVGVGFLAGLDLLVDATDDRGLARFLTEVSNGLGLPMLRLALDGTGELELGRSLTSHGGAGHACQLCSWTLEDLTNRAGRTPCPGQTAPGRPPTLAGGAIGVAVAALGLLQAQRLLGKREAELALDREVILDLSNFGLFAMELSRAPDCISGHERWELVALDKHADEATLADLLTLAEADLETDKVLLELFAHPLRVEVMCECGATARRLGTDFLSPGRCSKCGADLAWRNEIGFSRLTRKVAARLGALEPSLADLGLPQDGAMIVARSSSGNIRYTLALRGHDEPSTFDPPTQAETKESTRV